ncbi:MAG: VWA domain-containing protein [Methylococcaceae bacterium]|nr:VWA domain-containing protein [Methylococcaceae bacterium]
MYRYLLVVDITQSMNARDYHRTGLPADRLGFVKVSIRQALHDLPCGSELGLGLFTTHHTQLLLEPLEICQHFSLLDDTLEHIDWRMAWAADSHIAHGLYSGLREAARRGKETRLAFFSDGQQFPPEPEAPSFDGKPGEVGGVIVGVGGSQPVPIPRLDRENRPQGFWESVDLRDYLPASAMPGQKEGSAYYLSHLDESALRGLAAGTGLGYHRLETPEGLVRALMAKDLAAERMVATDFSGMLALLALFFLLLTRLPRLPGRK